MPNQVRGTGPKLSPGHIGVSNRDQGREISPFDFSRIVPSPAALVEVDELGTGRQHICANLGVASGANQRLKFRRWGEG